MSLSDLSSVSLRIQGVSGIAAAVQAFAPTLIISILNPEDGAQDPLAETTTPIVRLRFHDSRERHMRAIWARFDDLDTVAAALDAHGPEAPRLLIHCQAGQRRSPAIAIFALAHLLIHGRADGLSAQEAEAIVATVFAASPHAEPDGRILSLSVEHLDGGATALYDALEAHTAPKPKPESAQKRHATTGGKTRKAFHV